VRMTKQAPPSNQETKPLRVATENLISKPRCPSLNEDIIDHQPACNEANPTMTSHSEHRYCPSNWLVGHEFDHAAA
jgi:hypothetical protein